MKPSPQFRPVRCELRLPTVDLACAQALLDRHATEITALVEEGRFPAWNISLTHPPSRSGRFERRFLVRALRDYAEGPITSDEDFIVILLYGQRKPSIRGIDFSRAWNCDSGHTINLVKARVLALMPGTSYGRGRGLTVCITWESAVRFARERRIA
jgi:hypothetical protein